MILVPGHVENKISFFKINNNQSGVSKTLYAPREIIKHDKVNITALLS